jgi:hypothetical protein
MSGADRITAGKLQHRPAHASASRSAALARGTAQGPRNSAGDAIINGNLASGDPPRELLPL